MNPTKRIALALACALPFVVACSEDPAASAPAARVESAATPTENPEQPATGTVPANDSRQELPIDEARSSVGFTGSKVTDSHTGTFSTFTGSVRLDPSSIEQSSVQITIQMGSVQIEPERLRGHLLSPDLFDVAQFPTAAFQSTRIVAGGEGGSHTVTGNLTLHGQTRAITFPANITLSDAEMHATAEFTINRRDFGIVYPGMPDDLIRDGVVIRFDVRAPRS
jgi:polyisoprenoid-binding protein YceI